MPGCTLRSYEMTPNSVSKDGCSQLPKFTVNVRGWPIYRWTEKLLMGTDNDRFHTSYKQWVGSTRRTFYCKIMYSSNKPFLTYNLCAHATGRQMLSLTSILKQLLAYWHRLGAKVAASMSPILVVANPTWFHALTIVSASTMHFGN